MVAPRGTDYTFDTLSKTVGSLKLLKPKQVGNVSVLSSKPQVFFSTVRFLQTKLAPPLTFISLHFHLVRTFSSTQSIGVCVPRGGFNVQSSGHQVMLKFKIGPRMTSHHTRCRREAVCSSVFQVTWGFCAT